MHRMIQRYYDVVPILQDLNWCLVPQMIANNDLLGICLSVVILRLYQQPLNGLLGCSKGSGFIDHIKKHDFLWTEIIDQLSRVMRSP